MIIVKCVRSIDLTQSTKKWYFASLLIFCDPWRIQHLKQNISYALFSMIYNIEKSTCRVENLQKSSLNLGEYLSHNLKSANYLSSSRNQELGCWSISTEVTEWTHHAADLYDWRTLHALSKWRNWWLRLALSFGLHHHLAAEEDGAAVGGFVLVWQKLRRRKHWTLIGRRQVKVS